MRRLAPLLAFLAACSSEARWELLGVWVEPDDGVSVFLDGNAEAPCPTLAGEVTVNGESGDVLYTGGEETDPDGVSYGCSEAEVMFGVPVDAGTFEVRVESDPAQPPIHARGALPAEIAAWSDDDLVAAYGAGETFTVQWTPSDLVISTIDVWVDDRPTSTATIEQVSAAEGSAVYRFNGTVANAETLEVFIGRRVDREPDVCVGVPRCTFTVYEWGELGPLVAP